MTRLLKKMFSKTAAIALLLGAVSLAYILAIAPLFSYYASLRSQIAEQRELLGRFNAAAADGADSQKIRMPVSTESAAKIFIPGASDALRLAELQSRLKAAAEAEGVVIKSARTMPVRDRDGFRLLGLEAQMSADIRKLQRILYTLESEQPHLFIETIQISPSPLLTDENPGAGNALDVRLGLYGAAPGAKG